MELTTGLILRKITQTPLSVSAHKLATLILDGLAWKDGFNDLPRGTAAFSLRGLADTMGVSRQHLSVLLQELEGSDLMLRRRKPHGKYAPWLFRFEAFDEPDDAPNDMSGQGDRSLSCKESHKTVFTGTIAITEDANVFRTGWAALIRAAKALLPCWNVDTQLIWDRFLAFNRARGNARVPAGFLLGFMRKWRTSGGKVNSNGEQFKPAPKLNQREQDLQNQIKSAPTANRQFHASDLCRVIGRATYDLRVNKIMREFGCPRFAAELAVHGRAVLLGEIAR